MTWDHFYLVKNFDVTSNLCTYIKIKTYSDPTIIIKPMDPFKIYNNHDWNNATDSSEQTLYCVNERVMGGRESREYRIYYLRSKLLNATDNDRFTSISNEYLKRNDIIYLHRRLAKSTIQLVRFDVGKNTKNAQQCCYEAKRC